MEYPDEFRGLSLEEQIKIINLGLHVSSFFVVPKTICTVPEPVVEKKVTRDMIQQTDPLAISYETEEIMKQMELVQKALSKEVSSVNEKIQQLAPKDEVDPVKKGKRSEELAMKNIGNYLWGSRIVDCANSGGRGDFELHYSGLNILVEMKSYTSSIPKREWQKFERDVENTQCSAALFITDGDVSVNGKRGLQMEILNMKPIIVVPDYNEEKIKFAANIIVSMFTSGIFAQASNTKKLNHVLELSNSWCKLFEKNMSELVDVKFRVSKVIDSVRSVTSDMTDEMSDLKNNVKKRKVAD